MRSAHAIQAHEKSPLPDEVSGSILRVLLYFKIFNYPIRKEELFQFVNSDNKIQVQAALAKLIGEGLVCSRGDFIWVMNHESIVENRVARNEKAEKYLRIARRSSKLLSWLPFIRCICISGSLSKYSMDSHSDIDYFIIVDPRRLWIVRTFFSALMKTLKVLGLEKFFCPNYVVTSRNLAIVDRNLYTAMEVITLIPVYNRETYLEFMGANDWVKTYFPCYRENIAVDIIPYRKPFSTLWKRNFFTRIDSRLFRFYKKRIERQLGNGQLDTKGADIVITQDDFKYHISNHKERILQQYAKNAAELSDIYGFVV